MNNRKQPAFPSQYVTFQHENILKGQIDCQAGFTKEEYITLRIALTILGTTAPQYIQQVGGTDKVLFPNPREVGLMARKFAKELLDQLDLDGAEMSLPPQPSSQWQGPDPKGGIDLRDGN
jgi:hypothetical protein